MVPETFSGEVMPAVASRWSRLHFTHTLPSHLKTQSYPQPAGRMGIKDTFPVNIRHPQFSLFFSHASSGFVLVAGVFCLKTALKEAACLTALLAKICCLSTEWNAVCHRSFLILITYMLQVCSAEAPLGVNAHFSL